MKVRFSPVDAAAWFCLVALGALQFALCVRARNFVVDTVYVELARSLLAKHWYGFNFKPQTMLPPGFPVILAFLIRLTGGAYQALVRAMPVFGAGAWISSYELLRRFEGRRAAAVICLLLATSPTIFRFSTRNISSDLAYFLVSALLLLAAGALDAAEGRTRRLLWMTACTLLIVVSVMVRSTGAAFLAAIPVWIGASSWRRPEVAKRRLRAFLPVVLAGLAAQVAWASWAARHQTAEWPLGGYPRSYLSQLRVKSGNYPELGRAGLADIAVRPFRYATASAAALTGLLSREWISPEWYSPATLVPVGLAIAGLIDSFSAGATLAEWYFVFYTAMLLWWPWDLELRFLFPIAPLYCLYLWRGARAVWGYALKHPAKAGISAFIIAEVCCLGAALWGFNGSAQDRYSLVFWVLGLNVAALAWNKALARLWTLPMLALRICGTSVVGLLLAAGVAGQVKAGLQNVRFDPQGDVSYPYVEAAQWLHAHSASSAVVMARKESLVYHYGERRVVWFPPSSDGQMLMDGIRRHHIDWIVVVDRDWDAKYWLPAEEDCFASLLRAYPEAFVLAHRGAHNRIFAVVGHAFTQVRSPAEFIGRAGWSARVPPDPLLRWR